MPGAPYDQYFENVIAPAMLDSGATPKQINTIISEFFFNDIPPPPYTSFVFLGLLELKGHEPCASESDPPGETWWRQRRGYADVMSEGHNWTRVATAEKILQSGFDETQIKRNYNFYYI